MTDLDKAREEWERVRQYRGPDKDKAADALIAALTAHCEKLEAEVARLNSEVRKWKSRRTVAEQKLGYEEKLRARAEADE
jgi:predicted  nucleic acid-binding Zn-ribbon protein